MRILHLSPWFPFPPDNGSKIRLYNLLRFLGQHNDITLLSFVRDGDRAMPDGLKSICHLVQTVPWRPFAPTHWRALAGFFSPVPRSLVDSHSPAMASLVRQSDTKEPYDVVVASTIDTAAYAPLARAGARVLEEHNFMTRWMQENYQSQPDLLRRARYWLTFWKYRRYEARVYSYFDACTMVSEIDASAAHQLLPNPPLIRVVPNCVDLEYYACDAFVPQPQTLIFNGSLTYSANLEALRYFLREIWPLIKAQTSNAGLRITGRTTESVAKEFSLDGVTLTGFLDDIRPAVGSSWVCVAPLRSGGGTRLKILEAMALGTPVVSTAKGAEGLDVTHGENILIADEPAEFARHTLAVLNDIQLRTHLATNARRLVETEYDWKLAGAKFEALLQEVVERRRA